MKNRFHTSARQIGRPDAGRDGFANRGALGLQHLDTVRLIVAGALGLAAATLRPDTPLLGSVPGLDSSAALGVLAALEDHFGIALGDDQIRARHFATIGSLTEFVQEMLEP